MTELADVTRAFIAKARDKYGLGRFMPDELPLLNEMARLCDSDDTELAHAFIGHKGLGDEFTAWAIARRKEVDALLADSSEVSA